MRCRVDAENRTCSLTSDCEYAINVDSRFYLSVGCIDQSIGCNVKYVLFSRITIRPQCDGCKQYVRTGYIRICAERTQNHLAGFVAGYNAHIRPELGIGLFANHHNDIRIISKGYREPPQMFHIMASDLGSGRETGICRSVRDNYCWFCRCGRDHAKQAYHNSYCCKQRFMYLIHFLCHLVILRDRDPDSRDHHTNT